MPTTKFIDWLSFTVPFDNEDRPELTQAELFSSVMVTIEQENPVLYYYFADYEKSDWSPASGRPPYARALTNGNGVTLFYSGKMDTILFEFSGVGCERLRENNALETLLIEVQNRVSRIDFAVDVLTEAMPSEIVSSGVSGRFKSSSRIVSETGQTEYVGSRKSERYLRIYRYNEPHPRHKMLRYEFVSRKQYAKDIVGAIISSGFNMEGVMSYFGNAFGIEHDTFDVNQEPIPVDLYRKERENASTLLWLTGTVAPTFKKLVRLGVIEDPALFIKEFFYDGK